MYFTKNFEILLRMSQLSPSNRELKKMNFQRGVSGHSETLSLKAVLLYKFLWKRYIASRQIIADRKWLIKDRNSIGILENVYSFALSWPRFALAFCLISCCHSFSFEDRTISFCNQCVSTQGFIYHNLPNTHLLFRTPSANIKCERIYVTI